MPNAVFGRHPVSSLAHHRPSPALACCRCFSPADVVAAAATDGGGRARQIVAVRRRPCRPAAARAFAVAPFSVWDRSCQHRRRR